MAAGVQAVRRRRGRGADGDVIIFIHCFRQLPIVCIPRRICSRVAALGNGHAQWRSVSTRRPRGAVKGTARRAARPVTRRRRRHARIARCAQGGGGGASERAGTHPWEAGRRVVLLGRLAALRAAVCVQLRQVGLLLLGSGEGGQSQWRRLVRGKPEGAQQPG